MDTAKAVQKLYHDYMDTQDEDPTAYDKLLSEFSDVCEGCDSSVFNKCDHHSNLFREKGIQFCPYKP